MNNLINDNKSKSLFLPNFFLCGVTGWCMEICFTALHSLINKNMQLTGQTSLWMFPIYGCAAFLTPVIRLLKNRSFWLRGLTYMSLIFSTEFLTGSFLQHLGVCPWDYGHSRFHIQRLIRLDYAPLWFCAGLFFESLLSRRNASATFGYKSGKSQNKTHRWSPRS